MNYKRLENDIFVPVNIEDLVDGDRVKKEVFSGVWQESTYKVTVQYDKFNVSSVSTTINGNGALPYSPIYPVDNGDAITMTANIVDDSDTIQTQLDQVDLGYPAALFLPVTKYAGGKAGIKIDEVYFDATIDDGVITVSGSLPNAGNWKLETIRINESLKAINADWSINSFSVDFMVK